MTRNYTIIYGGLGGTNIVPTPTTMTEEELYQYKAYNFFLTTITDGLYTLHSRNPKTIQDYHFYKVHCPKCNCVMHEALPAVDKHILPTYVCDVCYKD